MNGSLCFVLRFQEFKSSRGQVFKSSRFQVFKSSRDQDSLLLILHSTCNNSGTKKLSIRVITKLQNSEQSYKGKVKTHKYINNIIHIKYITHGT